MAYTNLRYTLLDHSELVSPGHDYLLPYFRDDRLLRRRTIVALPIALVCPISIRMHRPFRNIFRQHFHPCVRY